MSVPAIDVQFMNFPGAFGYQRLRIPVGFYDQQAQQARVRNVSDVADIEPTHNDADIDAKHYNG